MYIDWLLLPFDVFSQSAKLKFNPESTKYLLTLSKLFFSGFEFSLALLRLVVFLSFFNHSTPFSFSFLTPYSWLLTTYVSCLEFVPWHFHLRGLVVAIFSQPKLLNSWKPLQHFGCFLPNTRRKACCRYFGQISWHPKCSLFDFLPCQPCFQWPRRGMIRCLVVYFLSGKSTSNPTSDQTITDSSHHTPNNNSQRPYRKRLKETGISLGQRCPRSAELRRHLPARSPCSKNRLQLLAWKFLWTDCVQTFEWGKSSPRKNLRSRPLSRSVFALDFSPCLARKDLLHASLSVNLVLFTFSEEMGGGLLFLLEQSGWY